MYVDSHSIFRFVRGRDELHYQHHLMTDEATPQGKQVLNDCRVDVIHALSPQAKGKVERPYGWLQDHLVRICARENIKTIAPANQVLFREVYLYNDKWVHSTTKEIPFIRYQRALKEKNPSSGRSLFRRLTHPSGTSFASGWIAWLIIIEPSRSITCSLNLTTHRFVKR